MISFIQKLRNLPIIQETDAKIRKILVGKTKVQVPNTKEGHALSASITIYITTTQDDQFSQNIGSSQFSYAIWLPFLLHARLAPLQLPSDLSYAVDEATFAPSFKRLDNTSFMSGRSSGSVQVQD